MSRNKIYHKISDLAVKICQKNDVTFAYISKPDIFDNITFPHWYDLTATGNKEHMREARYHSPTFEKINDINDVLEWIELNKNLNEWNIDRLENYHAEYK